VVEVAGAVAGGWGRSGHVVGSQRGRWVCGREKGERESAREVSWAAGALGLLLLGRGGWLGCTTTLGYSTAAVSFFLIFFK
jgi:hypothetical protein